MNPVKTKCDIRHNDYKMVVLGEDAGTIAFTSSREDAEAIEKLIDAYMEGKANA